MRGAFAQVSIVVAVRIVRTFRNLTPAGTHLVAGDVRQYPLLRRRFVPTGSVDTAHLPTANPPDQATLEDERGDCECSS